MRKYDIRKFIKLFCKLTKKYVVYLGFECIYDGDIEIYELLKAAPYFNFDVDYQAIGDGEAFIVCNTKQEAYKIFGLTVGDDGPTKSNKYDGPCRVYACVYGPLGPETENT